LAAQNAAQYPSISYGNPSSYALGGSSIGSGTLGYTG
jgi:hypothetical protein